jgi:serpin B
MQSPRTLSASRFRRALAGTGRASVLALALAACEGSPPAQTSSSGSRPADVPPITTATAISAPPVVTEAPPGASDAGVTAGLAADVQRANAFTMRVLARTKKPAENALVSGTSLRQALATAFLGARGATAHEMAGALALEDDPKAAATLARAELDAWQSAKGSAEIDVASRLWIARDFALQPDFVTTAERATGAAPASVDYARPDDARKTINAWVSEKTKDKIPELLPQGSVDARTRLVITNAIWFKGAWQLPFPKGATKDAPFRIDGSKTVTAPMMHLTDSFRVATRPGMKVLEMRYAGSALAMLVVLPDDPAGLAKLDLGPDALDGWTSGLATARVSVTLPRFTFRSGGVMNAALQDLGMKLAFTDRADFGGISADAERLFVNDVFHQTWISVDELGTEAAAATGTVMRTTSLVGGPVVEFKADHPFLFLIEDTTSGRVLFAGRVATPR